MYEKRSFVNKSSSKRPEMNNGRTFHNNNNNNEYRANNYEIKR